MPSQELLDEQYRHAVEQAHATSNAVLEIIKHGGDLHAIGMQLVSSASLHSTLLMGIYSEPVAARSRCE